MLLGSTALDVAIGLVFVYLVVSLVCSALNEGVEAQLKNRSKGLERGICEMLTGASQTTTKPVGGTPAAPPGNFNIVQAIYDHPLISSLFKGDYATAKLKGELPSYIPARNFGLALLDIIQPTPASGDAPITVADLRRAALAFSSNNPRVSGALVALIDSAEGDVKLARLNIEHWFDSSMDRVSGWYKRRAQYFIFAFGMGIAALANIDSIAIVRTLSTDAGVRDALVAQAGGFAKQSGSNSPQALDAATKAPAGSAPQTATADLNTVNQLRRLGLPIGWDKNNSGSVPEKDDINGWVMKVIGILVTGLSVSLGAPFWFDLLNRFMVVRATVKPTEKSPVEKPKP